MATEIQQTFKFLGRLFLKQFYRYHRPIYGIGTYNVLTIGRWIGAINHVTIIVTIGLIIAHNEARTRQQTPKEAPRRQIKPHLGFRPGWLVNSSGTGAIGVVEKYF